MAEKPACSATVEPRTPLSATPIITSTLGMFLDVVRNTRIGSQHAVRPTPYAPEATFRGTSQLHQVAWHKWNNGVQGAAAVFRNLVLWCRREDSAADLRLRLKCCRATFSASRCTSRCLRLRSESDRVYKQDQTVHHIRHWEGPARR